MGLLTKMLVDSLEALLRSLRGHIPVSEKKSCFIDQVSNVMAGYFGVPTIDAYRNLGRNAVTFKIIINFDGTFQFLRNYLDLLIKAITLWLFAFQELTANFFEKKYQRFWIFFFGLAKRISYQNFAAHARKRGLSKLPREAFCQALSSRAVGLRDTSTLAIFKQLLDLYFINPQLSY